VVVVSDGTAQEKRQTRVGHCKADETDVYVGRGPGGRDMLSTAIGQRGWLGNPHTVTEEDDSIWLKCPTCDRKHSRQEAVRLYEAVLRTRLKYDEDFKEQFKQLRGKKLGRHCSPDELCHGEIILELLDEVSSSQDSDGGVS
jgi:hypothetical protein